MKNTEFLDTSDYDNDSENLSIINEVMENTQANINENDIETSTEIRENQKILSAIEGILFVMGDSVKIDSIANALEIGHDECVYYLEELRKEYEEKNSGIRLIPLEDSYQMCSAPDIYQYLIKIAKQPKKYQLSDTLLETLSIIAYKQPVTKSEIEKIRGVSSDHAVNKLVEYCLVEEVGRLDAPGRPMLFGTTEQFLRSFGVKSLSDLPQIGEKDVERYKSEAEAEALKIMPVDSKVNSEEEPRDNIIPFKKLS